MKSHLNLTGSVHLVASFLAQGSKLSPKVFRCSLRSHLNLTGSVHLVASFLAQGSKLSPKVFRCSLRSHLNPLFIHRHNEIGE